jgi:hypothetical protein
VRRLHAPPARRYRWVHWQESRFALRADPAVPRRTERIFAALVKILCRLPTALTHRLRAHEVDGFLGGDGSLVPVTWFSAPVTGNGEVVGMTVLFTGDATNRNVTNGLAAHVTALEHLTDRLALATEIATALAQTLDTEEALARLGRLPMPRLADWASIDLRTDEGVQRVAVIGPEGRDADQEAWRGPLPALDEHSRSSLYGCCTVANPS